MSRVMSWAVTTLAAAGLWMALPQFSSAQEAKKEEPKKAEAKQAKEPKGRLPNFYADVVDKAQREKIYEVQKTYDDKIDALAAQLKELMAKRDAAVEAVLTPEQIKKIKELQVASKEKAKAALTKKAETKSEEAKPTDAKPTDAKPAAKPAEAPKKPTTKP